MPETPTEIRYFPEVNIASQSEKIHCGKFATMDLDLDIEVPPELAFRPLTPIFRDIDATGRKENTRYKSRSHTPVLTKIKLYGRLGKKFGRVHHLAVETPAEAMHALDTLFPGFRREIRAMSARYEFSVKIGDRYSDGEAKAMYFVHSGREISITPILEGRASGKGIGEVVLGAVLVVVGIIVGVLTSWTGVGLVVGGDLIGLGVGLLIGGIAALIAGTPTTPPKDRANYQFGGAENVVEQGAPCALAYGKVFCGSVVGSSSIDSKNVTIGSDKTPGPNAQDADFTTGGIFTEEMGDGTIINVNGKGPTDDGSTGSDTTVGSGIGVGQGGGGGSIRPTGPIEIAHHQERTEQDRRWAMGAGGSGSSGTGAKEDPDSLESREYAKIMDIIGEGPILGLVNGEQSIYLNDTPIQNPDGTYNFQDYEIHFLSGTQDQDYIPNFDSEEATGAVGFSLLHDYPYVSEIENENLDAIRITILVPKLEEQDPKTGDVSGSSLSLTISLACAGGSFVQVIADTINGKSSSNYTRSYLLQIPASGRPGPYQINVTRVTPDPIHSYVQNACSVESVTQIVYVKLKHPNTVKCGLSFDAEQFPNIPTRTYYVYGLMISVPSNYDPNTKVYANAGAGTSNGEWDGTFKTAWTCNPAWVLWDILTQQRYGIGSYIKPAQLDKWAFYAAAQYCDELVPNGLGGQESRYECHAYIAGRKEALAVVSDIAGIMRAAAAFIAGTVVPVMDWLVTPDEYLMPFGPANVINQNGADFSFSNSSRKARHNVALVQWNDPADLGRPKTEYVDNQVEIAQFGIRELNITAMGCYSRGQAHRQGLWALLTEAARFEIVAFSTGFEGQGVLPGDVVPISATFRAGRSVTGRISGPTTNTQVTLDRSVTLTAGNAYTLMWTALDGSFQQSPIANGPGTYTVLNFTEDNGKQPSPSTTWILSSTDLVPELYRILTVTRQNNQTVGVTAVAYNPSIYGAIEDNLTLETYPTSVLPSVTSCSAPSSLVITERAVVEANKVVRVLDASWAPSIDPYLRDYGVKWRRNNGNWKKLPNSQTCLEEIPVTQTGTYDFQVNAFNNVGAASLPLLASYTVDDANPLPDFLVSSLELYGNCNGDTFGGDDIDLTWQVNSAATASNDLGAERYGAGTGSVDPSFKAFQIDFYRITDQKLVYSHQTTDTRFVFPYQTNAQCIAHGETTPKGPYRTLRIDVTGLDIFGGKTLPAEIIADNPIPAVIDVTTVGYTNKFLGVTFNIPAPSDLDFAGIVIYASETQSDVVGNGAAGFIPPLEFQVYNGSNFAAFVIQPAGATYYYRFGAYDTFNPNQFVLSSVLAITNNFLSEDDFTTDLRNLLGVIAPTAAGLVTETSNRVTADSALQEQLTVQYAIVNQNSSDIEVLQSTVATNASASATFETTIQSEVNSANAEIDNLSTTVASQNAVTATQIEGLGVSIGGLTASVTEVTSATATIGGKLASTYALTLDTDGFVTGFKFYDNGSTSDVIFRTDHFKITTPGDSVITPFTVNTGDIVIGVNMRSANFVADVSGWRMMEIGKLQCQGILVRNPVIRYDLASPQIMVAGSQISALTFTGSQSITITHPAADPSNPPAPTGTGGGTIYYTLDGTDPTLGNSQTYTWGAPVVISQSRVLKAMCYIPDPQPNNPSNGPKTSGAATAVFIQTS
jgi:predicted phage tail protein